MRTKLIFLISCIFLLLKIGDAMGGNRLLYSAKSEHETENWAKETYGFYRSIPIEADGKKILVVLGYLQI